MNWHKIRNEQAFGEAIKESHQKPVLFFKHSTRCSISSVAIQRIEREWKIDEATVKPYLINVVEERPISNEIAQAFNIRHESPQALVIRNGKCVYHASHLGIDYEDIAGLIKN